MRRNDVDDDEGRARHVTHPDQRCIRTVVYTDYGS